MTDIQSSHKIGGFALGCQAYTFRLFSAYEAIQKTAQAGGRIIEFYPGQKLAPDSEEVLGHDASDETITALQEELQQHDVHAAAYGVLSLKNDEAENRRAFEFARKMGIGTITAEPEPDALDGLEKLAREYDIKIAIHNHPRRADHADYKMWDPQYVLGLVQNRDARIGACADTGHWARSGLNPVEALQVLKGRVVSSHLKDLNEFAPEGHDVPFGTGVCEVARVLAELKQQSFDGPVSIEYEHNWENSVPEVAQCIAFVREHGAK